MIVVGFLVALLCGIAVGSFFISLSLFLKLREEPNTFNDKVWISLGLQVVGFYLLTTNDYKEFPLLYKATAIGNTAGLLMTALYFARFICYHKHIYQRLQRWMYASVSLAIACFILIIFNSFTGVASFAMADEGDFPALLQQEKRVKYKADFEALKATHYKLNKHEYYYHDRMHKAYLQRYNNGQDEGEDTLIILRFTHGFRLLYYTYGDDGSYEDVVEKPLLDGFDATYNDGTLMYKSDNVFTNMDTFYFDRERYSGHQVYEETDIELEVIPQTIDNYIAYRESTVNVGERNMYVSLSYLQSKGIPITLEKYPEKER